MPSWRDLRNFCRKDGWEQFKNTSDHYFYRKVDAEGNVKRTKASRGTGEIHGHLWQEILKKQLKVSIEYFNKMT